MWLQAVKVGGDTFVGRGDFCGGCEVCTVLIQSTFHSFAFHNVHVMGSIDLTRWFTYSASCLSLTEELLVGTAAHISEDMGRAESSNLIYMKGAGGLNFATTLCRLHYGSWVGRSAGGARTSALLDGLVIAGKLVGA